METFQEYFLEKNEHSRLASRIHFYPYPHE